MNEVITPDIDENGADVLTVFSKAILGSLPFAGSVFAEITGTLIPNQRIDRMAEFLKILDVKLQQLGKNVEDIKEKMTNEGYVNIFEEGMWQSARSSSKERKEYIASILVNGLEDENLNEIQKSVFLNILNQLNDVEIIILHSYTFTTLGDKVFYEKHKAILTEPSAYMGSTQDEVDKATIYKTYREKLANLNLLARKQSGYEMTPLGRLFLKYIGLKDTI